MAIDPTSGETIIVADALKYVQSFRVAHPTKTKGFFAGIDRIKSILDQDDCIGIRMYNGIDDDGNLNLVLVGVDSGEKDMTDGVIVDRLITCPNECDVSSVLN